MAELFKVGDYVECISGARGPILHVSEYRNQRTCPECTGKQHIEMDTVPLVCHFQVRRVQPPAPIEPIPEPRFKVGDLIKTTDGRQGPILRVTECQRAPSCQGCTEKQHVALDNFGLLCHRSVQRVTAPPAPEPAPPAPRFKVGEYVKHYRLGRVRIEEVRACESDCIGCVEHLLINVARSDGWSSTVCDRYLTPEPQPSPKPEPLPIKPAPSRDRELPDTPPAKRQAAEAAQLVELVRYRLACADCGASIRGGVGKRAGGGAFCESCWARRCKREY